MSEPTFKQELRVTVAAAIASEAVAKGEAALKAEGYEPAWMAVSKHHRTGEWEATISGVRPRVARPETDTEGAVT